MKRVTIATWNVGSIHESNENKDLFLSSFDKLDSDVLCLQELPKDLQLFAEIREKGHYLDYCFVSCCRSHIGLHLEMGIALFSRNKIDETSFYKLKKVYNHLTTFDGNVEQIHDKFFLSAKIADDIYVCGHGFPAFRYIRPQFKYSEIEKEKWKEFCVREEDYALTFAGVQDWILDLSEKGRSIVIAGDFNVENPLKEMPVLNNSFFDIFSGIMTRPVMKEGFPYKTDGIIVPKGTAIINRKLIKDVFDHFALVSTIQLK